MNNLMKTIAATMMVLFSNISTAETGKVYVAFDFGQGTVVDACKGVPSSFSCANTTTVMRGNLGFLINQNFGVEVGAADYGTINIRGTSSGSSITGSMAATGYQFSLVGYLPLSEQMALIVKGGPALITATSTASGFGTTSTSSAENSNFAFGFGMKTKMSDQLSFRLMYENLGTLKTCNTCKGNEASMFTGGLMLNF